MVVVCLYGYDTRLSEDVEWLNRKYFAVFGRYYLPLVETIYRYNNRDGITRYLRHPELLTTELYRNHRAEGMAGSSNSLRCEMRR